MKEKCLTENKLENNLDGTYTYVNYTRHLTDHFDISSVTKLKLYIELPSDIEI